MSNKKEYKGVFIPREVWENPDFRRNRFERDLLVEIFYLDNNFGCVANNRYFADFFVCSQQNVSKAIKNLEEKGYLIITYSNNQTFGGRIIKVNKAKYYETDTTSTPQPEVEPPQPEVEPPQPEVEPPQPEVEPPQPEVEHNKTFNITFNKRENTPASPTMPPTESSTDRTAGVGINQQGKHTFVSQTKEDILKNNDLGENCLNNKLDGGDPRTAAKSSTANPTFDIRQEFEEVWKLYPRKEGKAPAFKKYEKLVKKTPSLVSVILEKVTGLHQIKELITTEEFKATRFRYFFKHFATWLNNEGWIEDSIQDLLDSTFNWNDQCHKLVYKTFRSEPVTQTEQKPQTTEPAPSQSDYLNAMNDMYNI